MLCIGCRSCLGKHWGVGRNWSDSFFFIWEGKSSVTFTKSSIIWTIGWKTSSYTSCFFCFFFLNLYTYIFVCQRLKGKLCTSSDEKQLLLIYTASVCPSPHSLIPQVYYSLYIKPIVCRFSNESMDGTWTVTNLPASNKTLSMYVKAFCR